MNRGLSIHLDLLRFVAALAVLLSHAAEPPYTRLMPHFLSDLGHDAVIVFFVLSGFVITWVSHAREHDLREYALSRAARIYSVALPAIMLTVLLALLHGWMRPDFHAYQLHKLWFYLPFWSAFGTDWWFLNETLLNNGPFWSLSYEVWYYVAFGAFFYLRGWKRWAWSGVALLIVGPRQWLLFPIWLAGSWLYHRHERYPLGRNTARGLFLASIVAFAALKGTHALDAINASVNAWMGGFPARELRYSQYFVGDYLIGALVVLNIHAARWCRFEPSAGTARVIRTVAGFTLSLYLFHMPLLKFYRLLLSTDSDSLAAWFLLLGLTLASVVVLGSVTEWRKRTVRRWLAAGLAAGLAAVRSLRARRMPGST